MTWSSTSRIAVALESISYLIVSALTRPLQGRVPRLSRALDRWSGKLLEKIDAVEPALRPSEPRLLPIEAYPETLSEEERDHVDARLRSQMHLVPTEPGPYIDNEGERWTLHEDGSWEDHLGNRRSAEWAPLVSRFGLTREPANTNG